MLINKLVSIIDLHNTGVEDIKLSPSICLKLKPDWRERKDILLDACKAIPQDHLLNKELLLPYVNNNPDMVLLLLAVGDKIGAWERFPSLDVEWNLPHWPCAYPLNRRSDSVAINDRADDRASVFNEADDG